MNSIDREVFRLMMREVREEKHQRQALIRALLREDAVSEPIPTDAELDARIEELREIVRKSLTNPGNSGSV